MALLDSHSCESLKSELDLFSVPPTQTSIEQTQYKDYYPVSLTSSNAPLEFHISSSDEQYLDLQQSFLHLSVSIRSSDGTAIRAPASGEVPAQNFVFPINYFASTLFKHVEVLLSGTQISPSDVQYAYRAYIEAALTYSGETKKEQLRTALYIPDKINPDLHDATVARANCANSGARVRYALTSNSQTFDMYTRIHHSLFNQPKLLLSKMDLRLTFHRHDPKFCLMSAVNNQNYRIHIDKAVLKIPHKTISASVRESHELALLKSPAKYPVRTSDIKFFTKPTGSADLSEPNLLTGILPRRVVLGIVSSLAFNGSYEHSPLNFAPYDVLSVQIRRNGVALPFEQYDMNFETGQILSGYTSLSQGLGRMFQDQANGITLEDYKTSGLALYAFDLSQDGADCNLSLLQEGKLSLHLVLRQALTESATIVVYMEKEGLIEVDKDRNVVFEN